MYFYVGQWVFEYKRLSLTETLQSIWGIFMSENVTLNFWRCFNIIAPYTVYIFYYILHLPLNINENVHVGKSAQRLIETTCSCVWEWDGNTHV